MVVTTILSILLVLGGAVLIVVSHIAVGVAAEVVALMSGSGTAWLRRLQQGVADRQRQIGQQEEEEDRVIRAMGVALMIPDEAKRSEAMAELASALKDNLVTKPRRARTSKTPQR
ncbi:MAG: hypothetical protein ACLP01_07705 [Solirubrobacteraceae bacterium]